MRRAFLSNMAVAGLLGGSTSSFATVASVKVDKRLLGTWRSDADRTVKLWRYNRPISDENRAKFEGIFGKMLWRITSTHIYSEFDGEKFSQRYSVLGSDSRSVVVLRHAEEGNELQQYFFEDENLLYVSSGYNIEFFKRAEA